MKYNCFLWGWNIHGRFALYVERIYSFARRSFLFYLVWRLFLCLFWVCREYNIIFNKLSFSLLQVRISLFPLPSRRLWYAVVALLNFFSRFSPKENYILSFQYNFETDEEYSYASFAQNPGIISFYFKMNNEQIKVGSTLEGSIKHKQFVKHTFVYAGMHL